MRGHVTQRGKVWYAFFRVNGTLVCKRLPDATANVKPKPLAENYSNRSTRATLF
jgi:hypothetical protein